MHSVIDMIGYVALVVGVLSYVVTQQNKTRFILGSSFVLWAIHYLLIGAMTTALTHMILLIRTWLSIFVDNKYQKHCLFWIVCSILCIITIVSWHSMASLIPLVAALNSSYALCFLDNTKMRKAMFITSLCWLLNGIVWGSFPQIMSEIIKILVNMYTINILNQKILSQIPKEETNIIDVQNQIDELKEIPLMGK